MMTHKYCLNMKSGHDKIGEVKLYFRNSINLIKLFYMFEIRQKDHHKHHNNPIGCYLRQKILQVQVNYNIKKIKDMEKQLFFSIAFYIKKKILK